MVIDIPFMNCFLFLYSIDKDFKFQLEGNDDFIMTFENEMIMVEYYLFFED